MRNLLKQMRPCLHEFIVCHLVLQIAIDCMLFGSSFLMLYLFYSTDVFCWLVGVVTVVKIVALVNENKFFAEVSCPARSRPTIVWSDHLLVIGAELASRLSKRNLHFSPLERTTSSISIFEMKALKFERFMCVKTSRARGVVANCSHSFRNVLKLLLEYSNLIVFMVEFGHS